METIDEQVVYLNSLGYSGALDDMLKAYYNDRNATSEVPLVDAQYTFLIGLGLSGSIPDMLYVNDTLFSTGLDWDGAWGVQWDQVWGGIWDEAYV